MFEVIKVERLREDVDMLRAEKKTEGIRYSLGGGRPEPYDAGIEDTCRRELLEEVNTEIEKPVYIGYQLVDEENGNPQYAQVQKLIQESGGNAQQAFYNLAGQMGVDPNEILNALK